MGVMQRVMFADVCYVLLFPSPVTNSTMEGLGSQSPVGQACAHIRLGIMITSDLIATESLA